MLFHASLLSKSLVKSEMTINVSADPFHIRTEQAKSADPRQPELVKGEDHPKVYVGWCKRLPLPTEIEIE